MIINIIEILAALYGDCFFMLVDLYLLRSYFAEQFSVVYEHDLVTRYGHAPVREAIARGWLDHSHIPCGRGRRRCVCRLTQSGVQQARHIIGGGGSINISPKNENRAGPAGEDLVALAKV